MTTIWSAFFTVLNRCRYEQIHVHIPFNNGLEFIPWRSVHFSIQGRSRFNQRKRFLDPIGPAQSNESSAAFVQSHPPPHFRFWYWTPRVGIECNQGYLAIRAAFINLSSIDTYSCSQTAILAGNGIVEYEPPAWPRHNGFSPNLLPKFIFKSIDDP